jgi:hypothetical protein
MKPATLNVQRIELDVNALGDKGLADLVSAILTSAQTSPLVTGNPGLQASVGTLKTASGAHQSAAADVIADEAKLATDKALAAEARGDLLVSLVQYRGLVETTAKTAAEVISTAFTPLERALPGPQQIPPGIDTYIPKTGHNARVSAQQTGTMRRYAAQVSVEPLVESSWVDLEGYAKSHWLTGYKPGTVVWVRFASVRGHARSGWCTPVAVTIP